MNDSNQHNIILDHLRGLRAGQNETNHKLEETNSRLVAIESHISGFHSTVNLHNEQIAE